MGRKAKKKSKNNANKRKTLKKMQMTRQQNSMFFMTRSIKSFGTKLSKNCPQVKPLISLT